jgi:hypothetical protein
MFEMKECRLVSHVAASRRPRSEEPRIRARQVGSARNRQGFNRRVTDDERRLGAPQMSGNSFTGSARSDDLGDVALKAAGRKRRLPVGGLVLEATTSERCVWDFGGAPRRASDRARAPQASASGDPSQAAYRD